MTGPESSSTAGDTGRPEVEASISIRTILLIAGVVALAGRWYPSATSCC